MFHLLSYFFQQSFYDFLCIEYSFVIGGLEYIRIRMNKDGIYLNNNLVSRETLDSLEMRNGYYFTMSLGVDPNADHVGGMNLFGKHFGDYSQDIMMKVEYE